MTGSPLSAAYRVATVLAEPLGPAFLRWRLRRGKEDGQRWPERLGHAGQARPPGRLAWLHGASVGEAVSVLPLAEALAGRGAAVLLTTGTLNGARALAGRLPEGVRHQFAPLDLPGAIARFLAHWRPDLAVLVESELWPNLVGAVGRAGVPLALVNARMSARSARRWAKAPRFAAALLGGADLCLCQTEADAGRFRALGAQGVSVTGLLKYDVPAPGADATTLAELAGALAGRPVWVAASTHEAEEAALAEAAGLVVRDLPGALLIAAPRQPHRGPALLAEAERRKLSAALRSRGEAPGAETSVYVADTLGELGLWYRLAEIVFVGNSLVPPGGGQNPIEPARLGCAVLHGPHTANFADVYPPLDAAGGGILVPDAAALSARAAALLADPDARRGAARAAAAAIEGRGGATARTLAALAPFLEAAAP